MTSENPAKSKINLYGLLFVLVSLLGVWGIVPEDIMHKINQTLVYLSGPILWVLRTWFTNSRLAWRTDTEDLSILSEPYDGGSDA